MEVSILKTLRMFIGLSDDDSSFDTDIIIHANAAFMVLRQLGVGSNDAFRVTGTNSLWIDFSNDISKFEMIKDYVCLRVKIILDPPTNASVLEAMKETIQEYGWRLNLEAEEGSH